MPTPDPAYTEDLPRDNASRLAIYDALLECVTTPYARGTTEDELFNRVISRLRVLVPRELHLAGDRAYVDEKVTACIEAGIIAATTDNGSRVLTLTGQAPLVRFPDGGIRDYPPGLELARERLERDNARLRAKGFDVRKHIPSIADDPANAEFEALIASMGEHGFMKQFPIVRYQDGYVADGIARLRAAELLGLPVEYLKHGSERQRKAANRRDTPLSRILIALDSNMARLSGDIIDAVHTLTAETTGRMWYETAADLALTRDWRLSMAPEYSPRFEVKRHPYRDGEDAKIQVTSDGKVQLRSLVETGGLSNYKIAYLDAYVPIEEARSAHSAGRKAKFARAEDLITGIAAMQRERTAAKLKVEPEWEQIRQWLVRTFGTELQADAATQEADNI